MMRLDCQKTGNGAFSVRVEDDGRTQVNGMMFATPREAYDHFHHRATSGNADHSAWNVCYHLEDVLTPA